MTLSEIAAGLEVTSTQRERGVALADDTETSLVDRLVEYADELPCTPAATATLIGAYTDGQSVGDAARSAGVTPMVGAKTLHRCGVAGISPFPPTRRGVVRDWLKGRIARTDAVGLTGGDAADFALATYVETHDPLPAVAAIVAAQRAGTAPLGTHVAAGSANTAGRGDDEDESVGGGPLGSPNGLR